MTPLLRRLLPLGAALLIALLIIVYWPESKTPSAVAPSETPARAEARLAQLRETAATVPAKEELLKNAQADLAVREKGLLIADTAPQAQGELIQIVRDLGRRETPSVEIRGTDGLAVRSFGDAYGEVTVSVQIECRIDQLINMLAGIAARPELVSTGDLRITSANPKEKTVGVHLTVTGVVPRKLVPEKHS